MRRSIAPLSVLLLSCALPFAASAATPTRDLCRLAETDFAAFLQLPDFADNILRMSDRCPKIALAVTNMATGTIATTPKDGGNDKANPAKQGPDYSDLLDRLKIATKNLNTATANVEKAQANLDRTLRRAKTEGLSEDELQALYALNGEKGDRRVLPDYTAAKRQALADYVAARDRLSAAEEKLDQANERAQPLVQKALELAGKASVAQEDLGKVLNGLSREERKAMLEKTLADAKQSVADLETRIANEAALYDQATKALKDAWNSRAFEKAVAEVEEKARDYAKAQKFLEDRISRDRSCRGNDCINAQRKLDEAAKELEKARSAYGAMEQALKLDSLISAYNQTAAALAASQAAKALAEETATEVSRQAKQLADLLSAAVDALTEAEAASQEARAATATEEAEVTAARAALEVALAKAETALEGSAEEQAALEDVYAAQDALRDALDSLGAAQGVAEELATEVAEIKKAPEKVSDVAEDLETASEESDAVEEDAIEDLNSASEAVEDYNDAQADLNDALEGDKATEEKSTEETSEPNT